MRYSDEAPSGTLPFTCIGEWPDHVLYLGRTYHRLLWESVSLDDGSFQSEVNSLREGAKTYNLPSLGFAIRRLEYFRANGIKSVNIGGTMGCGKSSVAEFLEEKLHFSLQDADYFHTDDARRKMSLGQPLTDADREPFLAATQTWLARPYTITTCSALHSLYRAVLYGQDVGMISQPGDARRVTPWEIPNPNLHLLLITLIKPYELALEELNASVVVGPPRLFDGKPHFIQVSKESEALAKTQGKTPLLQSQYNLLATNPPYPWDTLVIDALSIRSSDGLYTETAPLDVLLGLPFKSQSPPC